MKYLIILVVSVVIMNIAYSKELLIVSDIDDTIKRTNAEGGYTGGPFFDNDFTGLSNLYKIVLCKGVKDVINQIKCIKRIHEKNISPFKINYVTAAPSFLHYFGKKFLKENMFPVGGFYNRPGFRDSTLGFKISKIDEILSSYRENVERDVYLLGDNGSMDTVAYKKIENQNKETSFKFTTYIHLVYAYSGIYKNTGKRLEEGQIPFITTIDIAIDMFNNKVINRSEFLSVYLMVASKLFSQDKKEIRKVIPKWMRCHEYFEDFELPSSDDIIVRKQINLYHNRLKNICAERSQRR